MTYLTRYNKHSNDLFNRMFEEFFNTPSFSRKITIDSDILADKANYSIYELPNGRYEVRVQYSDDTSSYHRASTKETLDEAKAYVDNQIKYHSRQLEGPKKVWSGAEEDEK